MKKETLAEKVKSKVSNIAIDLFAVTIVGGALLAEKAKDKVKKFIEEQKVDRIPAL